MVHSLFLFFLTHYSCCFSPIERQPKLELNKETPNAQHVQYPGSDFCRLSVFAAVDWQQTERKCNDMTMQRGHNETRRRRGNQTKGFVFIVTDSLRHAGFGNVFFPIVQKNSWRAETITTSAKKVICSSLLFFS